MENKYLKFHNVTYVSYVTYMLARMYARGRRGVGARARRPARAHDCSKIASRHR